VYSLCQKTHIGQLNGANKCLMDNIGKTAIALKVSLPKLFNL